MCTILYFTISGRKHTTVWTLINTKQWVYFRREGYNIFGDLHGLAPGPQIRQETALPPLLTDSNFDFALTCLDRHQKYYYEGSYLKGDQILSVKTGEYIGFCVYRWSCLRWSPAMGSSVECSALYPNGQRTLCLAWHVFWHFFPRSGRNRAGIRLEPAGEFSWTPYWVNPRDIAILPALSPLFSLINIR